MDILIHVANFFPEPIGVGKYAGELAFHLARCGRRVEVVAAPPHYPGWSVMAPYKALRYRRERISGVSVWRCPVLTRANGGGAWRVLAPLSFAVFAAPLVAWRIFRARPGVVFCVEPTLFSAPAALLAARLTGARTILHVQDFEVDAAFVLHLRGGVARRLGLAFERFLLRRFHLTVTISHAMRDALIEKGVEAENCVVIRNWVDLKAIHPLPARAPNAFRAALGLPAEKFVILYAGHIGRKQALHVVVEAARLCREQDDLHFVIAGDGPEKAALMARADGLTNVSFLPLQPVESLNELLNLADLHVLPQAKNTADLVLPSKLGGMLASGRPIVAAVAPETELGRMVQGAAFLTPPEDAAALAETIRSAARLDLGLLADRSRALAETLSKERILATFEKAIFAADARGKPVPVRMDHPAADARKGASG